MSDMATRSPGILAITVRLGDADGEPLEISFSSYPDIWGRKEVGPSVGTIDEACHELRSWLEDYIDRYRINQDH